MRWSAPMDWPRYVVMALGKGLDTVTLTSVDGAGQRLPLFTFKLSDCRNEPPWGKKLLGWAADFARYIAAERWSDVEEGEEPTERDDHPEITRQVYDWLEQYEDYLPDVDD